MARVLADGCVARALCRASALIGAAWLAVAPTGCVVAGTALGVDSVASYQGCKGACPRVDRGGQLALSGTVDWVVDGKQGSHTLGGKDPGIPIPADTCVARLPEEGRYVWRGEIQGPPYLATPGILCTVSTATPRSQISVSVPLGEPSALALGDFVLRVANLTYADTDGAGCGVSHLPVTVHVTEVAGGGAPWPDTVTKDYARAFSIDLDFQQVRGVRYNDGNRSCQRTVTLRATAAFRETAADVRYDPNHPCNCVG